MYKRQEYDELRRSINQYMEGIVCESDSLDEEGTRIAEKINLLKKEKFEDVYKRQRWRSFSC